MGRLTVSGISRNFTTGARTVPVLRDLSFSIAPGEVVALFGPNGCGKSTLFQVLASLDGQYDGELLVDDKRRRAIDVGYVFQNFSASLFPWLSLRENIAFPSMLRNGAIKSSPWMRTPEQLLLHFKLQDFRDHYPYQVSGGMKQRVCFGRTLGLGHELLLLDEPFSALDAGGFAQVLELFESVSPIDRPPTLLICHDLDQAMVFADRVIVLSPRPATVVDDIAVPFPRPRRPDLPLDATFQTIRSRILETRMRSELPAIIPDPKSY